MVELLREMPLIGEVIDHSGLFIKPMHCGAIVLQQSDIVANTVLQLPEFGTVASSGSETILSAIPKHWMLFCDLKIAPKTVDDYSSQVGEANIVVTDMSDQYIVLCMGRKHARALLAKGCELDLSVDIFKPNRCARTLLAHMDVVICRETSEDFKLIVDVSFASHLWLWLKGAATEYSVTS